MIRFRPHTLRLYLVLDPDMARMPVSDVAWAALESGVTCLQLRWKTATGREVVGLARELATIAHEYQVPLIVNDRLDIALAAGADGVHLGVDDLPLTDARGIAGTDFIIGYSPGTEDDTSTAEVNGATYLGIGPYFATETKADAGEALGATGFRLRRRLTALPVVAIGGITAANAIEPFRAGADGVAVVSAISAASDPRRATRALTQAIRLEI